MTGRGLRSGTVAACLLVVVEKAADGGGTGSTHIGSSAGSHTANLAEHASNVGGGGLCCSALGHWHLDIDALLSETSVDVLDDISAEREALLGRWCRLQDAFGLGAQLAFVDGPSNRTDSCDHRRLEPCFG